MGRTPSLTLCKHCNEHKRFNYKMFINHHPNQNGCHFVTAGTYAYIHRPQIKWEDYVIGMLKKVEEDKRWRENVEHPKNAAVHFQYFLRDPPC